MAILSAGVRVNEFDLSAYAVELGLTRPLFVGGASWGPMDTPTRVDNVTEGYEKFGPKLVDDFGLQCLDQYLKQGDGAQYLRVGTSSAAKSEVDVSGPSGGTPAVAATGSVSFTGSNNPTDGETVTLHDVVPWLNLENDANGAAGNVAITVPVGGARIAVTGMAGGDVSNPAVGTVKLIGSALPQDGDQVVISDGATSVTFEFALADPAPNVWVDITGVTDPYAAMALLHTAIMANGFNVSSVNYAATKEYTFEFDDDASYTPGNLPVLIGADAAATLTNLVAAVGLSAADVTAVDGTVTIPQMDLTADTGGIDGNAAIQENAANIGVTGMTGGVDAVPGGTVVLMTFYAKYKGTFGDNIDIVITDATAPGAAADAFDISVLAPVDKTLVLQTVERFTNMTTDPTDTRYVEKVLEEGIVGEIDPSEYIEVDVLVDGDPANNTYDLTGGDDGITGLVAADYIGTVVGTTSTGLKAARNAETVEFNVLAVPGLYNATVINDMIDVAESRADCIALVDPPFGLDKDDIIDWHNGDLTSYPDAPTAPLDSSYATLTWSWGKVYDEYNLQDIWLPPSGFVAAQMAYTDRTRAPWFPIAGENRGRIAASEVEYSPDQDDRNELCPIFTGDNRVNPIVDFANGGPTIYGNRTLQRAWSQLTDVHVRRLLLHAEKLCATSVRYLVFEPNDPLTWKKFEQVCNKHLTEIAGARGLEDFRVQCDETTNTTLYRRTRRMKGKLFLIPQGAAEGIELDFSVYASGAEFEEAA